MIGNLLFYDQNNTAYYIDPHSTTVLNDAKNEDEKQRATEELDAATILKGLAHEDQGHVFSDKLVAYLTQDESPTYCKECDDKVVPPTENHRPAQVYYHKKEEW